MTRHEIMQAGQRMANALVKAQLENALYANAPTMGAAIMVYPDGTVREVPQWEFWKYGDSGEELAAALKAAADAPA